MSDNVVNINEAINLASLTEENSSIFDPLTPMLEIIMELDDNNLNDIAIEVYKGMIEGIFSKQLRTRLIDEIVTSLKQGTVGKEEAIASKNEIINKFNEVIKEIKPSEKKYQILQAYVNQIDSIYNEAIEKYSGISIVLPIKLDEGAQVPTYAHDTDTGADLYAAEDTIIPAHSISNMVRTGVHIALPEGWTAFIVPRSSIGMKTGLRLSNSIGVIDQLYRGALGVIYDNISDSDYTIKQGDRIAQMFILPTYRFKAQVVDELDETERGDGAYGSTGK